MSIFICARLKGQRPALVERLQALKLHAYIAGGFTIVDLPATTEGSMESFDVISKVGGADFRLVATEEGGREGEKKEAFVVCGFGGAKLPPKYVVPDRKRVPGEAVAHFSVPRGIISVSVSGPRLHIQSHDLQQDLIHRPPTVKVHSATLFNDQLPLWWRCSECDKAFDERPPDLHHPPRKDLAGWLCFAKPDFAGLRLPPNLIKHTAAILAAREKSLCKKCTHVHYALDHQSGDSALL